MKYFVTLACLCIMLTFPANAQTDKGLIAYWNFCGCKATDKSGNGYDGTLIKSPQCIKGISGDALRFSDAARNYILVPKDIKLDTPEYTIAAWFNVTGYSNGAMAWDPIISRMRNSTDPYSDVWNISLDQSGMLWYWFYDEQGQHGENFGIYIEPQKWQFLVLSVANGTGNFYLNNVKISTFSTKILTPSDSIPICIACNDYNQNIPNHFFNGALDEIRMYNREISSSERDELFQLRAPDPQMIVTPSDVTICQGDSVLLKATGNVTSHKWFPTIGLSCSNCPEPVAKPLTTTQYTVTATDPEGCEVKRSMTIKVDSITLNIASKQVNIKQGEKISLPITTSGNSIKWTPSQGLDCDTCKTPNASPLVTTTYYVTAKNSTGCTKVDSVKVIVAVLSCAKISGIINTYAAVTQISNSKTFVTVSDATGFKKDDQVLFIQMQGAEIDTANTVNYGTVKNNNGAGSYEFAIIAGVNGNTITFTQPLANQEYNVNGKIQLVSMPSFSKVIVRDELTCAPWNGTTGGILALSANCLSLEGEINVSGKGFRGGSYQVNPFNAETSDSLYATSLAYFGHKGEGIAGFGAGDKISGRGAPANGGGGGNSHNGGGGGGSNAGKGGNGGFGYALKPNANKAGGIGGSFTSSALPKIYLGGGGGAGQINDGHGSAGGNGGGIIIINAGTIENKSIFTVLANGLSADDDTDPANPDGCGGGGAGGTILINGKIDGDLLPVLSVGGDGGSRFNSAIGHGTGGGGGGGLLISTSDDILNLGISNVAAGKAGTALEGGTYGAADGISGNRLKITTNVLPGLLKAPDTALCQGCYPTIQTAQQLCSPATFSASDENYLLKTLELDNTQSSNISMKLSGSLPAAQMTGTLSLIDPTKPGTFVIRAVNVNDNTASYTSQVYPVPAPTASVAGENLSSANTQPNDALQWYYNGTIITGANGKTYKATKSGEYYIEATNIYGCKGVSGKAIVTLTDIGDDAVKDDFFALYPNPATEQLFIESRQILSGEVTLEITNILGESAFKSTYQTSGSSFKTSLPLENLPSGTYFVHITSGAFKKVYKIVRK